MSPTTSSTGSGLLLGESNRNKVNRPWHAHDSGPDDDEDNDHPTSNVPEKNRGNKTEMIPLTDAILLDLQPQHHHGNQRRRLNRTVATNSGGYDSDKSSSRSLQNCGVPSNVGTTAPSIPAGAAISPPPPKKKKYIWKGLVNPFRDRSTHHRSVSPRRHSTPVHGRSRSPSKRPFSHRFPSSTSKRKFSCFNKMIIGIFVSCLLYLSAFTLLFLFDASNFVPTTRDNEQEDWSWSPKSNNIMRQVIHFNPMHMISNRQTDVRMGREDEFHLSVAAQQAIDWQQEELQKVLRLQQDRASIRRERTRPSSTIATSSSEAQKHFQSYHFAFVHPSEEEGKKRHSTPIKNGSVNTQYLCGRHAQNSARIHPNAYPPLHALTNTSRVLITGILSPLGFHLALKLATECNVQVMLGVDSMYPNNYLHRMEVQEMVVALQRTVTKLQLPIIVPFVGLDRRSSPTDMNPAVFLNSTGEVNFAFFAPTHIVHLASSDPYLYRDFTDTNYRSRYNTDHPYVTNDRFLGHLFTLRQSMVGMDQVLMGLATMKQEDYSKMNKKNIHFTFVSDVNILSSPTLKGWKDRILLNDTHLLRKEEENDFFAISKLIDEIMARTYGKLKNVSSVSLRLPSIYGPWSRKGSLMYDLAERAISHWNDDDAMSRRDKERQKSMLLEMVDYRGSGDEAMDLLFVDDAIDAIVTAMQYRDETSVARTFDLSSGQVTTAVQLADLFEKEMAFQGRDLSTYHDRRQQRLNFQPIVPTESRKDTEYYLKWTPATTLKDGIRRQLAWHLDQHTPYGSELDLADIRPDYNSSFSLPQVSAQENGNEFLSREKMDICGIDDSYCLRGKMIFPCMSECAVASQCRTSVFDDIKSVSWKSTESCNIVVYTITFEPNVDEMKLTAPISKVGEEPRICSIAFVPRNSSLVLNTINSMSDEAISKFDVTFDPNVAGNQNESVQIQRRLERLNGRLSHKGWSLVWMGGDISDFNTLKHATRWLPQLSPKRLFHPSVQYAMYINEAFKVNPSTDDVLFVTSQMVRNRRKRARHEHQKIGKVKDKNKKLVIPEEPARKVGLLLGALKVGDPDDPRSISPWKEKMSLLDATRFMNYEVHDSFDQTPSISLTKQRESYERLQGYVNSPQYRSANEPSYKYHLYHWARTRWMVHDLQDEIARKFRCDWYQEHLVWGNELDHLSFAHVMARREVERRILRHEPSDLILNRNLDKEDPDMDLFTDKNNWHLLIDPYDTDSYVLSSGDESHEESFDLNEEEEGEDEERDPTNEEGEEYIEEEEVENGTYVRIMSEAWTRFFRAEWNDAIKDKKTNDSRRKKVKVIWKKKWVKKKIKKRVEP